MQQRRTRTRFPFSVVAPKHIIFGGQYEIGELLGEIMKARSFNNRGLARLMTEDTGLEILYLESHLSLVRRGFLHGTSLPYSRSAGKKLEILSYALYSMDVEKTHPIIESIITTDPRFTYPPKSVNGRSLTDIVQRERTTQ